MSSPPRLTLQRAIEIIEGAFQPLQCFATYDNQTQRLLFRVFPDNSPPFQGGPLENYQLEDMDELEKLILSRRRQVENQSGQDLQQWTMPSE